jgi:Leucine-rich repeat (LRR) protein
MTKELQTLSLMNNKISEFSQLEPLRKIEKLVQLDLSECPIADKPDYRAKVFEMFNELEILDNKDPEGHSIDYGEVEGDDEFEGEFEGDLEGEEEFFDDGEEEEFQDDDDDESDGAAKPSKKLKK